MNHHDTWGHPISRSQIRQRTARRNIILAIAAISSIVFASYAAKAWGNVNALTLNTSHYCGAC